MAALGWSHRHTLALWGRSLATARRSGRLDRDDLRTLLAALAKVTADGRLANRADLRRLSVRGGDVEVDGALDLATRTILSGALGTVPRVTVVRFAGDAASGGGPAAWADAAAS